MINNQINEVMSWRLITEIWRRFPQLFKLTEMHPGGGQSDCLSLITKEDKPRIFLLINRGGGIRVTDLASKSSKREEQISDWLDLKLCNQNDLLLEKINYYLGKTIPKPLPPSTSATLIFRFISDFLTHSVGKLDHWQCRNGYLDTSGDGFGIREKLFKNFTQLESELVKDSESTKYWFLIKNEDPKICLKTSGEVFRKDGLNYNLETIYRNNDRRIWPVIFETAGDLLP